MSLLTSDGLWQIMQLHCRTWANVNLVPRHCDEPSDIVRETKAMVERERNFVAHTWTRVITLIEQGVTNICVLFDLDHTLIKQRRDLHPIQAVVRPSAQPLLAELSQLSEVASIGICSNHQRHMIQWYLGQSTWLLSLCPYINPDMTFGLYCYTLVTSDECRTYETCSENQYLSWLNQECPDLVDQSFIERAKTRPRMIVSHERLRPVMVKRISKMYPDHHFVMVDDSTGLLVMRHDHPKISPVYLGDNAYFALSPE